MRKYDELTLNFHITDKEKFRKFHMKVFQYKKEETEKLTKVIGGFAVVSSWSNPFDENERLNRALEFALDNLSYEDSRLCNLISEGKTLEEARKIYDEEEN